MRRDVPANRAVLRSSPPPSGPWTLELPFTKPMSLNDRAHWRVKARITKEWREAAHVLARAQRIPACERVHIQLFYVPADRRPRDPLNLVQSLKAVEDGIVDAGVIPNDDSRHHESVMPIITPAGPARAAGNRLWAVITAL